VKVSEVIVGRKERYRVHDYELDKVRKVIVKGGDGGAPQGILRCDASPSERRVKVMTGFGLKVRIALDIVIGEDEI
jgi:hypothetical protein